MVELSSGFKRVFYGDLVFYVFSGVYEPSEDTFLLADNLDVCDGEVVLDVGTGCGILAVLSAFKASWVLAVDINPSAVRCARKNAETNDVLGKIDFICGDLFAPLRKGLVFDLVLFNAPYLPTEEEPKDWVEYAWSGGESGRRVLDRFLENVSDHIKRGGRLLLVQSSLSNIEETLIKLGRKGFKAEVIDEVGAFFEVIALIKAIKY
ncbi:MAG: class I SAM-dependent methyltransferase [Candidatus Bathyarchaeia archaeon]